MLHKAMACIILSLLTLIYGGAFALLPGPSGGVKEVRVLAGSRVLLPCDVTPPTNKDAPILVLFYNGVTGMPIYSIDARGGELIRSLHWSDMGNRAHFNTASGHQGLVIDSITVEDDGSYRCRVDFKFSPTRNMRVKLTVVVPPKRVTIADQSGQTMSGVIGPYPDGTTLTLTCQVTGGIPRPSVVWWHEDVILDEVAEVRTLDATHNVLSLPKLTRQQLFWGLTCRAHNSNLTSPLIATVTLDIIFPPSAVKITGAENPLSDGEPSWVMCETIGSRPPATLTWWMDGTQVTDSSRQVVQDGNVSRSSLQLHPTQHHDGAMLACRAENPRLEAAAIEDALKLTVFYSPKIWLRAGQNLDLTNIKEGDDVYFECSIQANPSAMKVQWFLNEMELQQNVSFGIIRSNQSLVLQKVSRTCSGLYTCAATNVHGSTTSNIVKLSIKFAPVCSVGQRWIYGGGREHPVNVTCSVDAHPEATHFRWAFNTSSEYVDIPQSRIRKGQGRSMVAYTPQTHHDFGSLICWGLNEAGKQKVPCVYHIVPASVPEPVHNCSSWQNASLAGEVVVACIAGWGGGLSATFSLEVRTLASSPNALEKHNLLAVLRDQWKPYFTVKGLEPGTEYQLAVVASNAQGPSKPTYLIHLTPIDVAEKRTSVVATEVPEYEKEEDPVPLVAILVGLLVTLLLCLVVLVVVVRTKKARARPPERKSSTYEKADPSQKPPCDSVDYVQPKKERRPDVILVKSGGKSSGEEEQLVIEYVRPRCDQTLEATAVNMRNTSVEGLGESDQLLQQQQQQQQQQDRPLPPAVSFHSLHSPTTSSSVTFHDPCVALHALSSYATRRHEVLPKAFVVSSSISPTSSSSALGGFPPPHHVQVRGSKGPSLSSSAAMSSSSAVDSSQGTRESRV